MVINKEKLNAFSPKYRAWLEDRKALVDVITINKKPHTIVYRQQRENTCPIETSIKDDVFLLQYIGQEDALGAEIYLGDILEVRICEDHPDVSYYVVVYKDFSVQLYNVSRKEYVPFYVAVKHEFYLKVIGNFLENPELTQCFRRVEWSMSVEISGKKMNFIGQSIVGAEKEGTDVDKAILDDVLKVTSIDWNPFVVGGE